MKEFKGTKGERELVFVSGACIGVGVKRSEEYTEMISNTILPENYEEYEKQKEQIIADALLEVAAPKLLEATKTMHEWISWKCKDEADLDLDLNLGNIEGLINEALGL